MKVKQWKKCNHILLDCIILHYKISIVTFNVVFRSFFTTLMYHHWQGFFMRNANTWLINNDIYCWIFSLLSLSVLIHCLVAAFFTAQLFLFLKVITADLLERCNTGTTAQKLTNDLLRSLYDRDCLASHSISGIVNSKRGTPKPALPAHEIQAILSTYKRRFVTSTEQWASFS